MNQCSKCQSHVRFVLHLAIRTIVKYCYLYYDIIINNTRIINFNLLKDKIERTLFHKPYAIITMNHMFWPFFWIRNIFFLYKRTNSSRSCSLLLLHFCSVSITMRIYINLLNRWDYDILVRCYKFNFAPLAAWHGKQCVLLPECSFISEYSFFKYTICKVKTEKEVWDIPYYYYRPEAKWKSECTGLMDDL